MGGTLAFAIGYTIHRTHVAGRRSIDLLSTLPVAIPGLVVGVAYLWAWIGIPGGLYGTIWILALAFIARFMPDTVKALSTSFLQIHRELEEAAWVCGKGMLGTIRTIVLRLARPGVIASMTLLFVLAIRELGSSLFLYTSNTMVMSVLLLDYYEGGNLGKTAAFSLVQTVLLGFLIGGANWLSRGGGSGQRCPHRIKTKGRIGYEEKNRRYRRHRRAVACARRPARFRASRVRLARADRGRQGRRQAGLLHGELRRGRAAGHQGVQQTFPRNQGRDGARARAGSSSPA
ncbi:MAG: ABC transporter permease subunit [Pseudolabrys sp.]